MHYAVPLVGVIGAALYGVLRLAYLFFYLPLRATPDEVGYGYSQVLADELIGAIELVLLTATVTWVSASEPQTAEVSARQCLLYLGDADGDSVFYDVHSGESLKVPSADILITLQDTVSVPIGC
jgi:hypothetical protein